MTDRMSSNKLPDGPEKGDRKATQTPSAKMSGANKRMFWAFFAMVLAIISLQFAHEPVKQPPELNRNKAAEILAGILNRAADDSKAEWEAFAKKAIQITDQAETEFTSLASDAAGKVSTYSACKDVVYYIAHDKVWGGNKTDEFLKAKVGPVLEANLRKTAGKMKSLLENYHANQQKILLKLGASLNQVKSIKGIDPAELHLIEMYNDNLNMAVDNLSGKLSELAVALSFDAFAIYNGLLTRLITTATGLATKFFAKPAARAAASILAPILDGPLPIGDIIGGIGFAYTAYEISSTREQFAHDLESALRSIHREQLLQIASSNALIAKRLNDEYQAIYESLSKVIAQKISNSQNVS